MGTGDTATATGEGVRERALTPRRILVDGASLGILADVALRGAPGGLGWTIWVLALAVAAVSVARYDGLVANREQRGWLALAVACAIAFSWRDAEELRVANVLGTLVALSMFAMSAAAYPAPSVLAARLRDVIAAGAYTVRDLLVGAPTLVARDADLFALPAARGGASWTAVRALLFTAPLAFVFTVLLSRADPVFASFFRLPTLDVAQIVPHLALAGVFAWLSAGWLRGAVLALAPRPTLPAHLPLRLGHAEVIASLGTVIALFALFVSLQLRWFFGGADVVLATTGLTVAEYARRGFFELVAVSALVLPLILGTRAAIDDARLVRRHRQLSNVLLALLAAIIASAVLRMRLYVGYFGLTTDRLYATALMGWIAVVSVALALTVLRGRARPFAAIAVLSGFATLGALNIGNPELIIARGNLSRTPDARGIDYEYLTRLSGDAAPAVVHALRGAAPSVHACAGARALRKRWVRVEDTSWNLGARLGRGAVEQGMREDEVARLCAGVAVGKDAGVAVNEPASRGP